MADTEHGGEGEGGGEAFLRRFDRGADITDEEALREHDRIAAQIPPSEYRAAAIDAFSKIDAKTRAALGMRIEDRARRMDLNLPSWALGHFDATSLADLVEHLHRQDPTMLGQVLGAGLPEAPPMVGKVVAALAAACLRNRAEAPKP